MVARIVCLAAILFTLDSSSGYGSGGQPGRAALRLQEVRDWYEASMRSAIRDVQAAQKLKRERDARIRSLIDAEDDTTAKDDLDFEDLLAIACAYEYLTEHDQCIRFSRLAIQSDGQSDKPYFPLMRSLVNLRRVDEADKAFHAAKGNFPPDSEFHTLHGLLYAGWKGLGEYKQAARHIDAYVDYLFTVVKAQPNVGHRLATFLDLQEEAYVKIGEAETYVERLRDYRSDIASNLADMVKGSGPTEHDRIEVICSMYHAHFELLTRIEPEMAGECMVHWFGFLLPRVVVYVSDKNVQAELGIALKELRSRPFLIQEPRRLNEIFDEALEALSQFQREFRHNAEHVEALKNNLQHCSAFLKLMGLHRDLVGAQSTDISNVSWTTNGSGITTAELENNRVILLYFWDPERGGSAESLRMIQRLQNVFRDKLRVMAIGRFCGFNWDSSKSHIHYSSTTSEEEEVRHMHNFLRDIGINVAAGLMRTTSPLAERYGVKIYPQTVLIDRRGRIYAVEIGASREILKQIEETISALVER
jgi:tetratricopeptide (TPR) repeat protein